jgi:hypothetical protein
MLPRMKTALYRTKGPPEARLEAKFCLSRAVFAPAVRARHSEHPLMGAPKPCAASTK